MTVHWDRQSGYIESCATVLGTDSPVTLRELCDSTWDRQSGYIERAVRQYLGQTVRLH